MRGGADTSDLERASLANGGGEEGDSEATAQPQSSGVFEIFAKHSRKCLDVLGWGREDLTGLIQYGCHNGDNQKFRVTPLGDGSFSIVAVHSGKCLDVLGWSRDDGAALVQYTCHGGDNQKFRLVAAGEGALNIVAVHSGKCLDVYGWDTADLARITQYACHGGPNQAFSFNDRDCPRASPFHPNACTAPPEPRDPCAVLGAPGCP